MNALILKSHKNTANGNGYAVRMDTNFVHRFLGHLRDEKEFCTSCSKDCVSCRSGYGLNHSSSICGVITFSALLPAVIDDADEYLPAEVPPHDILIAISVNEEILMAFIEKFPIAKGIIVPIEGSRWISPNAIARMNAFCVGRGIEVAFPKPFCAFDPQSGILLQFKNRFGIGKPLVEFATENGTIQKVKVLTSAPCGATYYMARGLMGKTVDNDLEMAAMKLLSCYPCTADTAVDPEFGDSIMHKATQLQAKIW